MFKLKAEVASQGIGRISESLIYLFFSSTPCGEILRFWTTRPSKWSSRPKFGSCGQSVQATTYCHAIVCCSPQGTDLKMDCFLAMCSQLVPVDSLVNFFIGCKLRQRRDLGIQKGNEGSNPTCSATQSELQRNVAGLSPKYAKDAHFSR
jgi:hypothetical protein